MRQLLSKKLPAAVVLALAGLCVGTAFAQEPGNSITIDPNKVTITTSPLLYGIFFAPGVLRQCPPLEEVISNANGFKHLTI